MNLIGVVFVYNPIEDDFLANIRSYINDLDTLIIWQNSASEKLRNLIFEEENLKKKTTFLGSGENKGIAFAVNRSIDFLKSSEINYTHLLLMDQDSSWENFSTYKKIVSSYLGQAIFSPNINGEYNLTNHKEKFVNVRSCINSGMILSKEVLTFIGEFNELYSVDCVDYDYCFRANLKDILIFKVVQSNMNQVFGNPFNSRFLNLQIHTYNANRLYFITRNHILLWKNYSSMMTFDFKLMIVKSYIIGRLLKIWLFENKKLVKSISILNGLFDGIMNFTGRKYSK
jgi:rhamnosyltransferase